jgi:hypothetical protein
MNALKSLVSGLITAASTALILFGSGAHGQEVKDLATLPPIETIDAQTDITVFLQNGVPNELRLAALRRAWTVDPAIRDFKGPQENDWNFNDPNSVPGFGELGPEVDVKRTVAKILGEAPRLTLARRSDQAN